MNIIECKEVNKIYNSVFSKPIVSLYNFTASIQKNKITALLGANGAGKSTLLRLISAIEYPSSGEIFVNTYSVLEDTVEVKKEIGFMTEVSFFYPNFKVIEFLQLLKNLRNLTEKNIERVIALCQLEDVLYQKIKTLSKGYSQRLSLSQAIIHSPSILILDEPSSGLDPKQAIAFKSLIKNLNTTCIFSSHSTNEIEELADNLLVMDEGKLLYAGSLSDFLQTMNEKKLEDAYLGILKNFSSQKKGEIQ